VLKANMAHTAPDFSLKDVPGTSGRLDVACRCLISAFYLPEKIRKNVIFHTVLCGPPNPTLCLTVDGEKLKSLSANENDIAQIFFNVLSGKRVEGFKIEKTTFQDLINKMIRESWALFELNRDGTDYRKIKLKNHKKLAFIMGDHLGLNPDDSNFIKAVGGMQISLGNKEYYASHCITILNWFLDRHEE
jgi:tRNA (pseudouridine54-N1)-methyltransferase